MACDSIKFSVHGLIKLIERQIDAADVIDVARNGVVIFEYPKDKPYPGRPEETIWVSDFKTKNQRYGMCYL